MRALWVIREQQLLTSFSEGHEVREAVLRALSARGRKQEVCGRSDTLAQQWHLHSKEKADLNEAALAL